MRVGSNYVHRDETPVKNANPNHRSFLFLQSMPNWFFARLGRALANCGHAVHRINFNAGDKLFWSLGGAMDFRGPPDEWPDFLENVMLSQGVTDIVLFGDCRPLHRVAVSCAKAMGVTVHVCEEGYIRPHWVTFQRDGVNGNSTLPRDPAWYRREAAALAPRDAVVPVSSSFARRAWEDVLYNAAALTFGLLFPHYRTHRPRHRLIEYAGWSWKVMRRPLAYRRARSQLGHHGGENGYFLFPLQLSSDSQIREHSEFRSMEPAIEHVVASFANHADQKTKLVVKEHPLDDGLINWRRHLKSVASRYGVSDRVIYLEVGDIGSLIAGSKGVVTVNSTVGMLALEANRPVLAMGKAIYDMDGLTHGSGIDTFWTAPAQPDHSLFAAFLEVTIARCLLAGDLFSNDGLDCLVSNAVDRLERTERHAAAPAPAAAVWWNKCGA